MSDNSVDKMGELSNHEYFSMNSQNNLDFVIQKVKAKEKKTAEAKAGIMN